MFKLLYNFISRWILKTWSSYGNQTITFNRFLIRSINIRNGFEQLFCFFLVQQNGYLRVETVTLIIISTLWNHRTQHHCCLSEMFKIETSAITVRRVHNETYCGHFLTYFIFNNTIIVNQLSSLWYSKFSI